MHLITVKIEYTIHKLLRTSTSNSIISYNNRSQEGIRYIPCGKDIAACGVPSYSKNQGSVTMQKVAAKVSTVIDPKLGAVCSHGQI